MAHGIPISELVEVLAVTGPEKIPLVQNGVTSSVSPSTLASFIGGNAGSVTNFTTNQTLTVNQTLGIFTNSGAAGTVVLTLPSPITTGLQYTFVVAATQPLQIDVDGSDVIAIGELTSSAGGFISSDSPYSVVTLKALSSALWVAIFMLGSWTPA